MFFKALPDDNNKKLTANWLQILFAVLFLCMITGCGASAAKDIEATGIVVNKKGVIKQVIVEDFSKGYYNADELKGQIEQQIAAVNGQPYAEAGNAQFSGGSGSTSNGLGGDTGAGVSVAGSVGSSVGGSSGTTGNNVNGFGGGIDIGSPAAPGSLGNDSGSGVIDTDTDAGNSKDDKSMKDLKKKNKNDPVRLSGFELSEDRQLRVEIEFDDSSLYTQFNKKQLFTGRVSELSENNLTLPDMTDPEGAELTEEQLSKINKKHVVMTEESMVICTPSKILYKSGNMNLAGENTAVLANEGERGYLIY